MTKKISIDIFLNIKWQKRYRSISFWTPYGKKDIDRYLFEHRMVNKISIDIFVTNHIWLEHCQPGHTAKSYLWSPDSTIDSPWTHRNATQMSFQLTHSNVFKGPHASHVLLGAWTEASWVKAIWNPISKQQYGKHSLWGRPFAGRGAGPVQENARNALRICRWAGEPNPMWPAHATGNPWDPERSDCYRHPTC